MTQTSNLIPAIPTPFYFGMSTVRGNVAVRTAVEITAAEMILDPQSADVSDLWTTHETMCERWGLDGEATDTVVREDAMEHLVALLVASGGWEVV